MKSVFINILIGLALVVGGYYLLENSGKFVSQEKFDTVENLCTNATNTLGILQEQVTETTMRIKGAELKLYELSYLYKIEDQEYVANKTVSSIDTFISPIAKVWYNKEQPSVNTLSEPCEKLASYKEQYYIGSQLYFFIPGALLGLFGLSLLWNTLKTVLANLWKKDNTHGDWI